MIRPKLITYLLSGLFAFLFVFAGTGYNIVNYCCNNCVGKGIDYIAHHSCVSVHHEQESSCCDSGEHKHNHEFPALSVSGDNQICAHEQSCEVKRVHVDNFSVTERLVQTVFSFDFVFTAIPERTIYNPFDKYLANYSANPPPDLSLPDGREILANKAVLII